MITHAVNRFVVTGALAATVAAALATEAAAQSSTPTTAPTTAATAAATTAATAASSPVNVVGLREAVGTVSTNTRGAAWSQPDSAVRRDVRKVCPDVHAELPEALASAWHHVGTGAVVRVRFALQGQRVEGAAAVDGPRSYHRFVRTAVQGLQCRGDGTAAQWFELAVRFADPHELNARQVAVLAD